MVLQSTRWLALGYFTYFFSYGIFLPFWSVWLKGIGLTPETIGLLLGAGLVARFLGSLLIAPRVSDPSRLISALRVLALLTLLFAVAFWAGEAVARGSGNASRQRSRTALTAKVSESRAETAKALPTAMTAPMAKARRLFFMVMLR